MVKRNACLSRFAFLDEGSLVCGRLRGLRVGFPAEAASLNLLSERVRWKVVLVCADFIQLLALEGYLIPHLSPGSVPLTGATRHFRPHWDEGLSWKSSWAACGRPGLSS